MLQVRKAQDRGANDLGWLQSKHSFSFGNYFDPRQMGFSDLRVINDDIVQPGKGFDTHPHRDMEIFTYVLKGELAHKDSMGNGSIIVPGEVQAMSAGTGILHSEYNHSKTDTVHLLQIWIVPNKKGVPPRYQQTDFSDEDKRGKLCLVISPNGEKGSVAIHQDARGYAGLFDGEENFKLTLPKNRYAYIHVARGSLDVNGTALSAGDGARVREEEKLVFSQGKDAEILVFDLVKKE